MKKHVAALLTLFIAIVTQSHAQTTGTDQNLSVGSNVGVQADPFSGQATASFPLDVPPGRHGIQPGLALQYSSSSGNGWVGTGWKLDIGGVERNIRFGLNYSGDDYVFRLSNANADLVNIGTNEYRAKIEGGFTRVRKLTATDGKPYWEATDKKGVRYLFGQTSASRMADPADVTRIFKWCLDQVIDLQGNYMTATYVWDQGQGYLDTINYTGNGSLQPTNTVKFYRESRTDASPMYTTNYNIVTGSRLKTIDVLANGTRVRAYKLAYTTSASSSRSLLSTVQQYGKDATVDGAGTITSGTALPATTLSYSLPPDNFALWTWTSGGNWGNYQLIPGDYNGDGKIDIYIHDQSNGVPDYMGLSTGTSFQTAPWTWSSGGSWTGFDAITGDFNGDGMTDLYLHGKQGQGLGERMGLSTGSGFALWTWSWGPGWEGFDILTGDFNGDGKTDIYLHAKSGGASDYMGLSTGTGFETWTWSSGGSWAGYQVFLADFNGDGKTDLYLHSIDHSAWDYMGLSTGTGFAGASTGTPWTWTSGGNWSDYQVIIGDYNGDGKADLYIHEAGGSAPWDYMGLSNGTGFQTWGWSSGGNWLGYQAIPGDFNGDGKTDIFLHGGPGSFLGERMGLSAGSSFNLWTWSWGPGWAGNAIIPGDFNGDGRADIYFHGGPGMGFNDYMGLSLGTGVPDLLTTVTNGLGATTTLTYAPSTQYTNTLLPFPVQTVSAITINDGNGNVSTTNYTYSGGFYHIGERDFRGFNYAKTTGPVGPNGEQSISETWFHQGNDLDINTNTPNVANGYMKGKPYRMRVSDGQGHLYSEVTTTYAADADGVAPFFNPSLQVDTSTCDGGSCGKQTRTIYTYDSYGNVTREDQYGDFADASDDRTVVRSFGLNTTAWIVGLPISETIYQGIGTSNQAANTLFYYDGTTNCAVASANQTPTQGNLTRVVGWLSGGTNPETRMAYDVYGNVLCTRDANGNTTTMSYDGSATFPKIVTNAAGHQRTTQYYGVDLVLTDTGLYGQVKNVTDPNLAIVNTRYDVFGRPTQTDFPDGGWTTTAYNSFGTVGVQHIQTNTAIGLSSWTYFDGLGRTITAKHTGPDSKTVAVQTQYNLRGAVLKTSLPYFFGIETPTWKTFIYDPLARLIQATNPDASRVLGCTSNWITVAIDANNHRKRETRDAAGRLIRVDEYTGTYSTCTTDVGVPYATTMYQYDSLGNLRYVTDAKGNQSVMGYDSLSRKTSMHDPDMGNWTYGYDAVGNLTLQTDARGQAIYFQYNALNHRKQKDYDAPKTLGSGNVMYNYDGLTSNGKGRLTSVQDVAGTAIFYYDSLGRTTRSDKSLDGTTYTTQTLYDVGGRVSSMIYPTQQIVNYTYNGPLPNTVVEGSTAYVQYGGYNSQGQAATVTLANGVVTTNTYSNSDNTTCPQQNFRACTAKTQLGATPAYQDLRYTYDTGGNIASVIDAVNGNQTFGYDDINRLTTATGPYGSYTYSYNEIGNLLSNPQVGSYSYPTSGISSVQPHAVSSAGSNTYSYDNNGSMTVGAGRSLYYDAENRPYWIWTPSAGWTNFVYDGDGGRVKKIAGTLTTRYIGKLYECDTTPSGTACSRYIFAGSQRIAVVPNGSTPYYYHADHLGSSSVITDATGAKKESVTYYPYGATRTNTPSGYPPVDVPYKYTGKELDTSTGLYFYGARYYDSLLARFISADSIVPSAADPQAFNRYSYARNNPILYIDPTGHRFLGSIGGFFNSPLGQALGWAFMPYNQAFLTDVTRPYAIIAASVVAAVYTGGVVNTFVQASIFQTAAVTATDQVLIGANIIALAPTANAAGALVGGIAGGMVGGAIGALPNGNIVSGALTGGMWGGIGPLTSGWDPVLKAGAYGAAGGVSAKAKGKPFMSGFVSSLSVSLLSSSALGMRAAMIEQSQLNPANATGVSVGFKGDGFKLGGGRWIEGLGAFLSPLGGFQGGAGALFNHPYSPGSFADHLVEAFAGPHDYANAFFWYNETGNAINWTGAAKVFGETLSAANILFASPFVAASLIPDAAYPMIRLPIH